jgi:hypothetical protein
VERAFDIILLVHHRMHGETLTHPLYAAAAAAAPPLQVRIVEHAFDIVHLLTDQNPIQIVVDAIINR